MLCRRRQLLIPRRQELNVQQEPLQKKAQQNVRDGVMTENNADTSSASTLNKREQNSRAVGRPSKNKNMASFFKNHARNRRLNRTRLPDRAVDSQNGPLSPRGSATGQC